MDEKRNPKRFEGIILILLLVLSLPFFFGAIVELLEPIIVWVFLAVLCFWLFSISVAFDKTYERLERILLVLFSSWLLAGFFYFMRTAS